MSTTITRHTGPPCLASDDDEHVPVRCTLDRGHAGDHAADDGQVVVATWPAGGVDSTDTLPPEHGLSLRERFEQMGITPTMARWILGVYTEHRIDDPVAIAALRAYLRGTAAREVVA